MKKEIPEGKQQVYVEASYKEPIEGIQYSNAGLTVGVTKNVFEGKGRIEKEIDKQIDRLCEAYLEKFMDKILSTRNEIVDTVRCEMDVKYLDTIQKLKDEIAELKKKTK